MNNHRSYERYFSRGIKNVNLYRIINRPYSYSRCWTGTSLQCRLMRGNIIKKRLMSYSRYWTGTSLQWRLMQGNIIEKRFMSYSPTILVSNVGKTSPLPSMFEEKLLSIDCVGISNIERGAGEISKTTRLRFLVSNVGKIPQSPPPLPFFNVGVKIRVH